MGWASEQARKLAEEAERRKTEQQYQMFAAATIKAAAPALFAQLGDQLEADVNEFNQARGAAEVSCTRTDGLIEITKAASYPAFYVRLALRTEGPYVEIHQRRTLPNYEPNNFTERRDFRLDPKGDVHLGAGDITSISQSVLAPVFSSCS